MKKLLNVIIGSFLYLMACIFPLHAKNHVCNPNDIFAIQKGGKATRSPRTTNAVSLHHAHIEGQHKNGKRLLAAIIDHSFYPKYTALLKRKGLIHPAAFSEHLILNPDDNLEHINISHLNRQINALGRQNLLDRKKEIANNKKIKELEGLIDRKDTYNMLWFNGQDTHGSGVMEALHLIAPKAQLLPIDTLGVNKDMGPMSSDSTIAYSIRKAIHYGADVINLSRKLNDTPEIVAACKEAIRKGIAIITSAGNDSSSHYSYQLDEMWSNLKNEIVRNPKQDLFNKLNGKGIRFAGALEYGNDGEEKVATYSQHPSQNTEKHFIFAAGSHLPIHLTTDPDELDVGTSFSTPTVAGGYLLLKQFALDKIKQFALDKKYHLSPDQLLDIMHDSGRNVNFHTFLSTNKVYKSMDLLKAKRKIEEKIAMVSKLRISVPAKKVPPVAIKKVASVAAKKPIPVAAKKVTPIAAKKPTPVVAKKPTPVVAKKPTPVVAKKPAPIAAKKPAPIVAKKPIPVSAKKPIPVSAKKTTPLAAKKPIPVAAKKPTPVAAKKPSPIVPKMANKRIKS